MIHNAVNLFIKLSIDILVKIRVSAAYVSVINVMLCLSTETTDSFKINLTYLYYYLFISQGAIERERCCIGHNW